MAVTYPTQTISVRNKVKNALKPTIQIALPPRILVIVGKSAAGQTFIGLDGQYAALWPASHLERPVQRGVHRAPKHGRIDNYLDRAQAVV